MDARVEARDEAPTLQLRAIAFVEVQADGEPDRAHAIAETLRETGGEVIQVVSGLVLVVFDSSSTCLRCLRSLDAGARAGVSCGDVLYEEGLVHGLPVIEASRLKDAAGQGEVLCARRLARVGDLPEGAFRERDDVALKGLASPLPAVELVRTGSRP